ncbi:MAG: DNA-processing protein DprA [Microcystaceae cyanobacterium]
MAEEHPYWLAWSQTPKVGPVLLKRIWQQFGDLKTAWTASKLELAQVEGLGPKLIDQIIERRSQLNIDQLFNSYLQKNPTFWTPSDANYPNLLLEIPSPPPFLHYRGRINLAENQGITPMVGIVGTRSPTEHGRRWTWNISQALAKQGFTVVSGMALGIDRIAHEACLKVGGRTIAVLGTGVDVIYPPSHHELYQHIQEKGLIISEYKAGTKPDRGNFPARNRIIAGLCRAVLVMEAPQRSGALITARYANEFNRDIYTLPNSPDVLEAEGCLRLIHQGADMILKVSDLLEMLGAIPQLDQPEQLSLFNPKKPEIPDNIDLKAKQLLQMIASDSLPFDMIVAQSQLPAAEVSVLLLQLELDGYITQLPGMRYQRK